MEPSVTTAVPRSDVRLQRLIEANRLIVAELSLEVLLRRVVESAREITDARHAALVVIEAGGQIEHFLHSGMDAATVATIGLLPQGRGLLGAIGEEPVRLAAAQDDPRSCGVPEGHPPIGPFLGVPIRSASSAYGHIYLTNGPEGAEFTAEDEDLIRALAATTSIAVQNARLYAEAQQRHEWTRVSSEVSHRWLAEESDPQAMLRALAESVRRLARADSVLVLEPVAEEPGQLMISFADGLAVGHLTGIRYPVANSIAWRAMQEGRGLVVHDLHDRLDKFAAVPAPVPIDHVMVFPLQGSGAARGALAVGRVRHGAFSSADLQMAEGFAAQVALAMEIAEARQDRQRVALLEERARIARELNDRVVQRLFAAGLTVQGVATTATDAGTRDQLLGAVGNLDETIRSIRDSIFELHDERATGPSLQAAVLAVVIELANDLGQPPVVEIDAQLEGLVSESLVDDVATVLRETLTLLAEHRQAIPVTVDLGLLDHRLALTVTDQGPTEQRTTGRAALNGLRRRTERRGGALSAVSDQSGGLRVRWTTPLR